jgi:uncharacterized membrane protein YgcG
MVGPVARRLRLRGGPRRAVAATIAGCAGLLAAGMAYGTASAQVPLPTPPPGQLCVLIVCLPSDGASGTTTTTPTPTPSSSCTVLGCLPPPPTAPCDVVNNPTSCLSSPTSGPTPPPTQRPRTSSSSSSSSSGSRSSSSSSGSFAAGGLGGGFDPGAGGNAAAASEGVSVAAVPGVQQLSATSGLEFGHAPILWPLFGVLDVLGIAAVVIVARRLRSADAD